VANDPADLLARYRRLTARQQTLVRYLADAASRAEIAEALGISLSLVDKETAEVMRAFDLQEEGLTRAQRCVELRRMYFQLRRLERSEAAPVAPAGGEPVPAPPVLNPRDIVNLVFHDRDLAACLQDEAIDSRGRLVVDVIGVLVPLDGKNDIRVHQDPKVPRVCRQTPHILPNL